MKRLKLLNEIVSVQYNDTKGLINIDFQNSTHDLTNLCIDNNINTKIYFPIGIGFIIESYEDSYISCKILLIEKSMYGDSYDEIKLYLENHPNEIVKATAKIIRIKATDLKKYIKRIDNMSLIHLTEYIHHININVETDSEHFPNFLL